MPDTDQKTDKEKGDEVLKRMLKTPPKPKTKDKAKVDEDDEKQS